MQAGVQCCGIPWLGPMNCCAGVPWGKTNGNEQGVRRRNGGHEGRGCRKRDIIKFDCSSRIPDEWANVKTR